MYLIARQLDCFGSVLCCLLPAKEVLALSIYGFPTYRHLIWAWEDAGGVFCGSFVTEFASEESAKQHETEFKSKFSAAIMSAEAAAEFQRTVDSIQVQWVGASA